MIGRTAFCILVFAFPLLAGCGDQSEKKADADKANVPQNQVALSSEDVEHLGIATVAARAVKYVPDVRGYGTVMSFDALAQSASDLTTARAAARQSQEALVHARALAAQKLITRDTLGMAERQATSDQAQLLVAERKQAATFGRNAPWQSEQDDQAIFSKLATGGMVLIHVTFPSRTPEQNAPQAITVRRVQQNPNGKSWKTSKVWEAPADPNLPGWGLFALVANSDLAPGERVLAEMPVGQPISGVLIPGDASLLSGDSAWCYLQIKPGVYVRHALDVSSPMDGGYFVQGEFKPGEAVVTRGGSLLLARELNPSSGDKD